MAKPISHTRLKQLLRYDPESGNFYRLATMGSQKKGSIAGTPHAKGYVDITVDGMRVLAHRLAWFYMTGEWPVSDIDHKDQDKTNNRWANLRPATRSQNMGNCGARSNSQSGIRGVRLFKRTGRWVASIRVSGNDVHLGYFATADEADAAYRSAALQHYGEFAPG